VLIVLTTTIRFNNNHFIQRLYKVVLLVSKKNGTRVEKRKYTIADIARELQATSSTISRALQDSPRISLKLGQAAQALAREHNYEPDFRALNLRKGTGKTIGVLVPKPDRHYFSTLHSYEVATTAANNVLVCQL